MRSLAVLALSLVTLVPLHTLAQQDQTTPTTPKLVREKFWLAHQKSNAIWRLLHVITRDRAGRPQFVERLAPAAILHIQQTHEDDCLIIEGTESAIEALKRGILVADVEMVSPNRSRKIVLLTPKSLSPQELRERILKLPDAGVTQIRGDQIGIDGSPKWVDDAIRVAIRAEIGETTKLGESAP